MSQKGIIIHLFEQRCSNFKFIASASASTSSLLHCSQWTLRNQAAYLLMLSINTGQGTFKSYLLLPHYNDSNDLLDQQKKQ